MPNFQSAFKALVPAWLSEGDGGLVLHSLAVMKDVFLASLRAGLEARFPTKSGDSALTLTGDARGIIRGRSETSAHYAARLKRWRFPRGHRVRGDAFALLEQISEYFGGIHCRTIDIAGNVHDRTAAGVETFSYANAWDWDGEPPSPNWGRFWVILYPNPEAPMAVQPNLGDPALWGGALGTAGTTIGQTGVTADDVNAVRWLMSRRNWKPAGTLGEWIIVSLDGTDPAPDGEWLHWSKMIDDTQSPARSSAFRYWVVTPELNTYGGDPGNFALDCVLPGGVLYGGDPTSFPTSLVLPSGAVYAGTADSFPLSARLVDDGDLPQ